MHIAVCDDNIADRKQTERLLSRQSDRLFKEGHERLYIDSYGNSEAFMHKPQMYHGLFIDMTSSPLNGVEIAKMLLEKGVKNPIIMCCSSLDYRTLLPEAGIEAENIHFLDKPIKVAELTEMLDYVQSLTNVDNPRIEIRDKNDTIYAQGDDIICAKEMGRKLRIWLEDGRVLDILGTAYNFYGQCVMFPQICPINNSTLVNVNHIKSKGFLNVQMDNGRVFIISPDCLKMLAKTKALIDNQSQ